jgi:hypothetical protein
VLHVEALPKQARVLHPKEVEDTIKSGEEKLSGSQPLQKKTDLFADASRRAEEAKKKKRKEKKRDAGEPGSEPQSLGVLGAALESGGGDQPSSAANEGRAIPERMQQPAALFSTPVGAEPAATEQDAKTAERKEKKEAKEPRTTKPKRSKEKMVF